MPVNDRLGRSEIIVSKRIPNMGRSRGVQNSNEDDPNQRSKRRRSTQSGENLEANNVGTSEGKRALYHCNYCNKDITGKIRIKCAKCPDFDLCVECFSVGAEVTPHKSNHPYRVMDNLSFPLIVPDWNADEEILLLEGLEMYGVWNWAEVAEHVGTKSKAQCIDHYNSVYLNSPCFPLPDMSHVIGKNRKELLAMAKELGEDMRGSSISNEATPKALSPFSPSRVKIEDSGRSPSTIDVPSGDKKNPNTHKNSVSTSMGAGKKASGVSHMKAGSDGIKLEGLILSEDHSERSIGGKKPKVTGEDGPSLIELSGFNPKRQEFDPEYDNDAEQSLAEMEFKDTDTDVDRELKLRILRIYSQRLDERKRRKDFILERNLLYPNSLEKELTNEDREIYERCRVFMRFLSKEEHEAFIKGMIREHKIRQKIEELQEYRAAGCHTLTEGEKYAAEKRKRETEMNMLKGKESSQSVVGGKVLQRGNRGIIKEKKEPEESAIPTDNHKPKGNNAVYTMGGPFSNLLDDWDITGLPGTNLLSAAENRLCRKNRLLPAHYLKMKDVLVMEAFNGNTMKKSDAYDMFKVDRNKVDNIYELLIRMGLLGSGQTS